MTFNYCFRNILLALGTLFFIKLGAQNSNLEYKYALKAYNLTSYTYSNSSILIPNNDIYRSTSSSLKILSPAIALQWKTKKNRFNEISVNNYGFNRNETYQEYIHLQNNTPNGGATKSNFEISLAFEHYRQLVKNWNKKWIPFLGMGINQDFGIADYKPVLLGNFPTNYKSFNTRLYLMPRLQYYLSQKLFLDFNAPIILAKNELQHNAIRDPQRPTSQQRYYTNNFQLFPAEFNFRIGLGVKI